MPLTDPHHPGVRGTFDPPDIVVGSACALEVEVESTGRPSRRPNLTSCQSVPLRHNLARAF
jgi:hypothetical protein